MCVLICLISQFTRVVDGNSTFLHHEGDLKRPPSCLAPFSHFLTLEQDVMAISKQELETTTPCVGECNGVFLNTE